MISRQGLRRWNRCEEPNHDHLWLTFRPRRLHLLWVWLAWFPRCSNAILEWLWAERVVWFSYGLTSKRDQFDCSFLLLIIYCCKVRMITRKQGSHMSKWDWLDCCFCLFSVDRADCCCNVRMIASIKTGSLYEQAGPAEVSILPDNPWDGCGDKKR